MIQIEKEGKTLSREELEKLTGAKWIPRLDFECFNTFTSILKTGQKLYKKGEMTLEQIWLGKYFHKEIASQPEPDVVIRWINPQLGWGVFANRDLRKMEFIAEYAGKVRKRQKSDTKNAFCFEYVLAQGFSTPYTIDAMEQGGLARYLNHSSKPNLNSCLATFDHVSHVIFYVKEPIAKGTQLCYDYGPDYWSKRLPPIAL